MSDLAELERRLAALEKKIVLQRMDAARVQVASALHYFDGPTSECPKEKRGRACRHCHAVRSLRRARDLLEGRGVE